MAYPTITGNGPNSRTTLQNIHSGERSFQKDLATVHSQIALMQTALTNKGYNTYGADGKFGDNTLNAVKAFQRAYGLTADGYFGRNSLLKLEQLIGGHLDPTPGGCTVSGTGTGGGGGTYIGLGTVVGGRLYCRKQPQVGYDYWGQFENGAVIALYSCSTDGWYETRWPVGGSNVGYVMSQFVSLNSSGGGNGEYYSSNDYLNQAQMTVNAQYILDYLRARGWSKNAVCGMLGNMQSESTINPGIWQNRNPNNVSGGYGLVQWTPSTKFTNWATQYGYPINDMVGQLERIRFEVVNGGQWYSTSQYPMTFSEFTISNASPYYLAGAFLRNYERPGEYHYDQRGNQAENWYSVLN